MNEQFKVCIVGAGVIGLAIARELLRRRYCQPDELLLLDQESSFGQHTSSRNSEVIHAGLYYPQSSLKATLCVRGKHLLYEYCQQHNIAHRRTGKLVIAQSNEISQLETLQQSAADNGVTDTRIIEQQELTNLEPMVRGAAALLSPSSGIIDSHHFMQSLCDEIEQAGALFVRRTRFENGEESGDGYRVITRHCDQPDEELFSIQCHTLINCGGLSAQQIAARIHSAAELEIPPLYLCKGDYFHFSGRNPFSHLIYPLPEKNTRGLGIHATIDMGNQLRFGPDTEYIDTVDYDVDRSKKERFAQAIQRYFPALDANQLQPGYSGIRPKLASAGEPAEDFVIQKHQSKEGGQLLQLFGIESPGLTASLAIAEKVARLLV